MNPQDACLHTPWSQIPNRCPSTPAAANIADPPRSAPPQSTNPAGSAMSFRAPAPAAIAGSLHDPPGSAPPAPPPPETPSAACSADNPAALPTHAQPKVSGSPLQAHL